MEAAIGDDSRKDADIDSLLSGEDHDLASSSSSEDDLSLFRSIPLPPIKRSSHVLGCSEDEDYSRHRKKKKRAIPKRP